MLFSAAENECFPFLGLFLPPARKLANEFFISRTRNKKKGKKNLSSPHCSSWSKWFFMFLRLKICLVSHHGKNVWRSWSTWFCFIRSFSPTSHIKVHNWFMEKVLDFNFPFMILPKKLKRKVSETKNFRSVLINSFPSKTHRWKWIISTRTSKHTSKTTHIHIT